LLAASASSWSVAHFRPISPRSRAWIIAAAAVVLAATWFGSTVSETSPVAHSAPSQHCQAWVPVGGSACAAVQKALATGRSGS
jgi:hypothetical protein